MDISPCCSKPIWMGLTTGSHARLKLLMRRTPPRRFGPHQIAPLRTYPADSAQIRDQPDTQKSRCRMTWLDRKLEDFENGRRRDTDIKAHAPALFKAVWDEVFAITQEAGGKGFRLKQNGNSERRSLEYTAGPTYRPTGMRPEIIYGFAVTGPARPRSIRHEERPAVLSGRAMPRQHRMSPLRRHRKDARRSRQNHTG